MNHTSKTFVRGLALSFLLVGGFPALGFSGSAADAARSIAIQHNGRVKSFDAFCRQTVETISGKKNWHHESPVALVLKALYLKEGAAQIPWIRMSSKELSAKLGLPQDRFDFSYEEIIPGAATIESLVRHSQVKRDNDERPLKLEQDAETLFQRMILVKELTEWESLKVIPGDEKDNRWLSPHEDPGPRGAGFHKLVELYGTKQYDQFTQETRRWIEDTHEATGGRFRHKIGLEICYFASQPFQGSWVAYLLAFVVITAYRKSRTGRALCIFFLAAALFLHSFGLVLRILILERPPVSNMYESMVYMNWALMVVACLFSLIKKNLTFASVGAAISALIMIYGTLLPLDSNLEVLVPVLRSNYWLTIHVLTIVSSYGVFGLAMGLGHRHLILEWRGKLSKTAADTSANLIYRVIQVGVLLLGVGTVLGGVWANESWGRFWGWDPKETWALITFLGYLVVVHLRYSKLINGYWMAVSSILGFLLVLMTWYGVNFVLGRGLHSYGFGSGGMTLVMYYLAAELTFLTGTLLKKYSKG
ncbi:MAG: cytochrome c biogenesis protein CcsA [Candidatus Omnitrophica bacterium]|nr:cytochrome c biogenesis protein CcsA [Candidatus Omnitrophota bacterium]